MGYTKIGTSEKEGDQKGEEEKRTLREKQIISKYIIYLYENVLMNLIIRYNQYTVTKLGSIYIYLHILHVINF